MNSSDTALRLKISEIFFSLQGEGNAVGFPTVFIRLTGCPLRCQYCDTAYAFTGGQWLTLPEILAKVAGYKAAHVCVTGGEPLAQANCLPLLSALCDQGFHVSLETSGALPVHEVDPRVARVVDVKTPGSGEAQRNLLDQLSQLRDPDQIKFVLCHRADYEWAREMIQKQDLARAVTVLLSPSFEQLPAATLADWILEDQLPVRMQLQMHKILWGNQPGR